MSKPYLASGTAFEIATGDAIIRAKRSASGPEIEVRIPIEVLASLGMHARRAIQGGANSDLPDIKGWKQARALPVQTAQVLSGDDATLGAGVLVFDPGTDVEIQFAIPNAHFAQQLAEDLQNIAATQLLATKPQ